MSATNRGAARAQDDHYGTPAWAVDAILPHIPLAGYVLDAGAGEGQIAARLVAYGVRPEDVTAVEYNAALAVSCRLRLPGIDVCIGDYLTDLDINDPDTVVMNPPYDVDDRPGCTAFAFVEQSVKLVGPAGTVAALLRLNWLEGAQVDEPERIALLRHRMPDVYVLPRRPQFGLNKHGKRGGDSCAYGWMVWGPGRDGRVRMLDVPALRRVR